MKLFTEADVRDGQFPRILTVREELVYDPPEWMKRGLQQTASGYGKRLNTGLKINYCGKLYRIYATCFSNVASCWFTVRGRKIYVD